MYPFDRPQSAIEGPCHTHSGELEAGEAIEGQGFQRFQLRPTGGKNSRITLDAFFVGCESIVGAIGDDKVQYFESI
jgi:hypothetical protein